MVIAYSQHSSSFTEALRKTFDGRHPCSICKVVEAGRCSERHQDQQKLLLKLDLFVGGLATEALYPPCLEPVDVTVFERYRVEAQAPPTPPPILT